MAEVNKEVAVQPVPERLPRPATVYQAISHVMASMSKEGISKDRKNREQGFSFRGIDDVMNALSARMSEAGLMILPRVRQRVVTERTTARGTIMFSVACEVDFDFVSTDGSIHTVRTWGEAQDVGDKATNKAMSAALKYACLQAFMIPTEGDHDADASTPPESIRTIGAAPKDDAHAITEPAMLDFLSEMGAADTLERLAGVFQSAYRLATAGGDHTALKRFIEAKDKRKAELTPDKAAA